MDWRTRLRTPLPALPAWVWSTLRLALLVVGLALLAFGTKYGGFVGYPALVGGSLCLLLLGYLVVTRLITNLLLPRNAAPPPEQYSVARGLIAQREYAAAAAELRARIAAHPHQVEGTRLLVEVLACHLDQPAEALALAQAIFARGGAWQGEHERLALLAADIALDHRRQDFAIALLTAALAMPPEASAARVLQDRLAALQGR